MFVFLLICVADTKITFGNNSVVAPLKAENGLFQKKYSSRKEKGEGGGGGGEGGEGVENILF